MSSFEKWKKIRRRGTLLIIHLGHGAGGKIADDVDPIPFPIADSHSEELPREPHIDDALLAHAERRWQAAKENAERYAAKAQLLYSGVVALFGLGLFKIEWFRGKDDVNRISSFWIVLAIKGLILLAMFFCGIAFWNFIRDSTSTYEKNKALDGDPLDQSGPVKHPSADSDLRMDVDNVLLHRLPTSVVRAMIYNKISKAADSLSDRNEIKRRQISRGLLFLLCGLIVMALAIGIYTVFSQPYPWR